MNIFIFLYWLVLALCSMAMFRKWASPKTQLLSYSIIAACRNESSRLPAFFDSLEKLDYPADLYEIILVDDASSDGSAQMLRDFTTGRKNTKGFFITEKDLNQSGKRQALALATVNAAHDILLFTDSDADVPADWISSYNHYFDTSIGMVIGYFRERKLGLVRRVKKIFSAGLFCSTVGIGYPFSCSGGNLAVRRSVFEKIGGYEKLGHFSSGDDKLLLKRVWESGEKVAYNSDIVVYEQNHDFSLHEYVDREIRHFGKFSQSAFHYQLISLLIVAFFICIPIVIIEQKSWLLFAEVIMPIYIFYTFSMFRHHEKFHLADYGFLVIYPYYALFFSIIGTFKKAKWKA